LGREGRGEYSSEENGEGKEEHKWVKGKGREKCRTGREEEESKEDNGPQHLWTDSKMSLITLYGLELTQGFSNTVEHCVVTLRYPSFLVK